MQKTVEPKILVDEDMKDVLESQVRGDATHKTDDRFLLESRVSENATLEFDYMELKEDGKELDEPKLADDFPQESGELNVLVDDHTMQDVPEPRLSQNTILELEDFEVTEDAQREQNDLQMADDVPKESGKPQLPVDKLNVLVDDHTMQNMPELRLSQNAILELEDFEMREDAQRKQNDLQMANDVLKESGEPQLPVDNMQTKSEVLVDDHLKDVPELPVPENAPQENSKMTEDAQQELDDPQESSEPQLSVVDDRQGLAESQVEEFPQVCSQT